MSDNTFAMFLETFDYVHDRLIGRLEGLQDDEYLWEPVPGSWTVRPSELGGYTMDRSPSPEPEVPPVTTIAWRLCHIGGDVLEGFALSLESGKPSQSSVKEWPGSAARGIRLVETGYSEWRAALASRSESVMFRELGSDWGPYASDSNADLVMHVFDEFVHHSAEVALLRDLYRAEHR